MMNPYVNCHPEIPMDKCTLQTCCLAQSNFLYRPDLSGNLFFTVFFAVFIIPHLVLGIRYKTWGFMVGIIIGLAMEVVGYVGRVYLHYDPFSNNAFLIYLIFVTIAPVFISASIYLTLTRIIMLYGQHLSWLPPRFIAIGFMTSDFISLVLQATGGALAEVALQDKSSTAAGQDVMIGGLFLQAVSLGVFCLLWAIFMAKVIRGVPSPQPEKVAVRTRRFFVATQGALVIATVAILIRSIFRVVELWEGFSGPIWNNQTDFLVLDGGMISLATLLLTVFHAGIAFKDQWHINIWSSKNSDLESITNIPSTSSSDTEAKVMA